jgi:hypothetical protein
VQPASGVVRARDHARDLTIQPGPTRPDPHPPERIISFGIDIPDQEPHAMTPHNRNVDQR